MGEPRPKDGGNTFPSLPGAEREVGAARRAGSWWWLRTDVVVAELQRAQGRSCRCLWVLEGPNELAEQVPSSESSSEGRRGVVGRRGCSTGKSLLLNKLLGFEFLQNPRVGMGTSVPEQVLQRSLPRWERNWWWQPERRVLWDVLGR